MVAESFRRTALIRKAIPNIEIYNLYDSNKNSCCVDILGAEHIQYAILFHLGAACFSEAPHPKITYILPELAHKPELRSWLQSPHFEEQLQEL